MNSSPMMNSLSQMRTGMAHVPADRIEEKVRVAQNATGEKQKNEIKRVAQEFEAIFIAQLLKVMRETIEESGLTEGGFGKSIYTELFDQEVSMSMARRGSFGIADILNRSLAGKESGTAATREGAPGSGIQAPSEASPAEMDAPEESEIPDFRLPIRAPVSSAFGNRRDPISHNIRFHKGLDLAAPEGTGVVAALPGRVLSAGYQGGYGNTVLVQHANGVQTRYGHLASINVKAGDPVDSETVLGAVGQTGRSTGPHLHFEVIRMGEPVDPLVAAKTPIQSWKQNAAVLKTGG